MASGEAYDAESSDMRLNTSATRATANDTRDHGHHQPQGGTGFVAGIVVVLELAACGQRPTWAQDPFILHEHRVQAIPARGRIQLEPPSVDRCCPVAAEAESQPGAGTVAKSLIAEGAVVSLV